MITPRLFFWLLAIILMEGYVVLAYELLAIRQIVPYVGSGTDTVSIIIASVLMPLAFGYQAGGGFKPRHAAIPVSRVREKLARNVRIASIITLFGISYMPMSMFFISMYTSGLDNRLVMTMIYAGLFLVVPVYLLGQTIPLVSNFFSHQKLPKVTGTILFVSTIGSFLGAVFSTLVLMSMIGVNYTALFCLIILALILIMIGGKEKQKNITVAIILVVGGYMMNNTPMLQSMNVVAYNQYNIIRVYEDKEGSKHITLNGNSSSKITKDGKPHEYLVFIEKHFIDPTLDDDAIKPINILVIGAGGFTLGMHDTKNHYDFLDIDGSLKDVSEKFFLPEKLTPNREFIPMEARAFMAKTDKKYDLIILDAYLGHSTLPEHLVTRDFFAKNLTLLNSGGAIVMNFIISANFSDSFSRNLDQTLRSVFPYLSRQIVTDFDHIDFTNDIANILYIFHNYQTDMERPTLYTDLRNTTFLDAPARARFKKDKPVKRSAVPTETPTEPEAPEPDANEVAPEQ